MAEKKFSELPSAASLTGNELAALSQMQSGSLASVKSTLQAIANWFAVYAQYTTALQTTDKSIAGAINELKQLISLIPQFSIEVVQTLPTEDISDTTIYLVPAEDPEVGNYYEEYIHVNNTWELVGTTAVDLSAYYTKLEVDGLLADKLEADDFEANQTASANPITLETKQAGLAKSCVVEMNPIQSGTGDPSPTNIRPISGRTEVSVVRTGKNVFGGQAMIDNAIATKGSASRPPIDDTNNTITVNSAQDNDRTLMTFGNWVKSNTQYTFIFTFSKNQDSRASNMRIVYTDGTTINIPNLDSSVSYGTKGSVKVTTSAGKTISYLQGVNMATTSTLYCDESGIFEGSVEIADFEPYTAETHTKEFGQTVYGGSLDLTNGGATSTDDILDNLSSLNWYVSNNIFYTQGIGVIDATNDRISDFKCTFAKPVNKTWNQLADGECIMWRGLQFSGKQSFAVKLTQYSTVADFTNAIQSDWKFSYPKETPTKIQLPPEAVTLLKGLNVISTDGDKVQVEFSDIPVGDYSVLLGYIKSLEARIAAVEP